MSARKTPSFDVIEDRVFHFVKKNPRASVPDVANHMGLSEYRIKRAWRSLIDTGEIPVFPKKKSPGRPVGMTGAIAAQVLPRECGVGAGIARAKAPGMIIIPGNAGITYMPVCLSGPVYSGDNSFKIYVLRA